ncbi:SIR2 family protein [Aureliella helgolandensis]|uniref:SIR2-like domain-containing protein n=1 Tax=Aureliella helgolandensis TaxID=2527968 RepID=A0A518GDM5_9BACT|nr:hypothetical protein [Aureliella helgolandensis]QDV26657.1 hypothetical protein Q31a_50330 [Aureliella helgolandensis]
MDTKPKHTYILGAGFSMPLGGPSFEQLLSPDFENALKWVDGLPSEEVYFDVFQNIGERRENAQAISKKRFNVEELLEKLDDCEHCPWSDTFQDSILDAILSPDIAALVSNGTQSFIRARKLDLFRQINMAVRARLALETSYFVHQIPKSSERWVPYVEWFKQLTSNDTIISFNYDPVVELAAEFSERPYIEEELIGNLDCYLSPNSNMPKLLKLHGSSNWMDVENSEHVKIQLPRNCGHLDEISYETSLDVIRVVGGPGSTKRTLASGKLKAVWDAARIAIENCNILSIVGYSMPATDNFARDFILESLLTADRDNDLWLVDVVLGPGASSPAGQRAREILRQLLAYGRVQSSRVESFQRVRLLSQYAQDYLPWTRPTTAEKSRQLILATI